METVAHDGRRTAYREAGSGEPGLLCVHGSTSTHAAWKGQLSRLPRRVVALDLSSHGESGDVDAPAGEEALSAYAEDVRAVAEETGTRALAGNSLGGAVVLHLALSGFDPDALVLAGTGAKLGVYPDLLEWLDGEFERAIEFIHEPDRVFHDPDDRLLAESMETARETGSAVALRNFRTCDAFDVRDRLGEVTAPALAITGEHDGLTPPWYHEYLASNLPNGRLAILPDAAHASMLERPEAFNEAVEAFLQDVL